MRFPHNSVHGKKGQYRDFVDKPICCSFRGRLFRLPNIPKDIFIGLSYLQSILSHHLKHLSESLLQSLAHQ